MRRIPVVAAAQPKAAKKVIIVIDIAVELVDEPQTAPKICTKNTSASSEWASERAHSLRYEAVFEIQLSTNSIVSII